LAGISRRELLVSSSWLMAAAALPSKAFALSRDPSFTGWPILQGRTDDFSTSILILHTKEIPLNLKISDPQNQSLPYGVTQTFEIPLSSSCVSEIFIAGLVPGLEYKLQAFLPDGSVIDQRTFRSLDTNRTSCRFAVVSCMDDSYGNEMLTMWETLSREKPEFVVLLGDTVYADHSNSGRDRAGYSRRYIEARSRLAWYFMPQLTPTLATWDDHDFGENNGDKSLPMASYTRTLFRQFFGTQFTGAYTEGFGVGSLFQAFGQRFFLLDDRSFRDRAGAYLGSHLGEAQKEWLLAEIAKSSEPCWLMNGSQFFGGYLGIESFESDQPADFEDFIGKIARLPAPVCFVSGDIHFSEIMAIEPKILGYETFEFTSSAMHSFTLPGNPLRGYNPRRLASEWRHNFMMFESDVTAGWQFKLRTIRDGNKISFAHDGRILR
jgi:alkaline phosphatase D